MTEAPDEQPRKPQNFEEFCKKEGLDPKKVKFDFGIPENIMCFEFAGTFLHNLDYIDDPVFYDAVNATLGFEDDGVVTKTPLTLQGYGLLDKDGELVGFSCFDSQIAEDFRSRNE